MSYAGQSCVRSFSVEAALRLTAVLHRYTLFAQSEKSGMSVMSPLWVEFPGIKETFGIEDEHMVGSALLVHPVVSQGAAGVTVYLPGEHEVRSSSRSLSECLTCLASLGYCVDGGMALLHGPCSS